MHTAVNANFGVEVQFVVSRGRCCAGSNIDPRVFVTAISLHLFQEVVRADQSQQGALLAQQQGGLLQYCYCCVCIYYILLLLFVIRVCVESIYYRARHGSTSCPLSLREERLKASLESSQVCFRNNQPTVQHT